MECIEKHQSAEEQDAIEMAIKECMEAGILQEYLERKGSQVMNMLIAEYDYETDIKIQRDEAWEDGIKEGIKEGIKAMILDNLEDGKDEKAIIEKIKKHFQLSDEQSQSYFEQYALNKEK